MEIHTIGFTRRTAEEFFTELKSAGIRRLIDVRLNNVSQLAGFAKSRDLEYFLRELVAADYAHEPLLAPDSDLLGEYRSGDLPWEEYEERFLSLMESREIESAFDWDSLLDRPTVLLCSEYEPDRCHRRLVVEYLNTHGKDLAPIRL